MTPYAYREPGYSVFLGGIYKVFGTGNRAAIADCAHQAGNYREAGRQHDGRQVSGVSEDRQAWLEYRMRCGDALHCA